MIVFTLAALLWKASIRDDLAASYVADRSVLVAGLRSVQAFEIRHGAEKWHRDDVALPLAVDGSEILASSEHGAVLLSKRGGAIAVFHPCGQRRPFALIAEAHVAAALCAPTVGVPRVMSAVFFSLRTGVTLARRSTTLSPVESVGQIHVFHLAPNRFTVANTLGGPFDEIDTAAVNLRALRIEDTTDAEDRAMRAVVRPTYDANGACGHFAAALTIAPPYRVETCGQSNPGSVTVFGP